MSLEGERKIFLVYKQIIKGNNLGLVLKKGCILLFLIQISFCSSTNEKRTEPSLADLNSLSIPPMQRMALELRKSFSPNSNYKLIVLTFTTVSGKKHSMGNILAEKLTTELAKSKNLKILDRLMYAPELDKNELSLSGSVVLEDLKKIGKLFNLDAIVTGIVTTNGNGLDINCRIIDPKTGYIIGAEEVFYPLSRK